MSFANYLEKKLVDHLLGHGSFTPPTVYVGLSKADPGENAAGLDEPSGGAYARIATDSGDWNSFASGVADNTNVLSFAEATASWGTITHFGLFDAVSGGNLLGSGSLSVAKDVGSGDQLKFNAGNLDVELD